MSSPYTLPGRADRACKYGWFGAWDWLINGVLRMAGTPRVAVEPGEVAIDPHIHSMFSRCSISHPADIFARAARLGLGGVGILDHNDPRGVGENRKCCDYLKAKGLLPQDFILISGVEISSTQGHIGALFVTEPLPGDISPELVVKSIHEAGGLAVAVHPYHSTGIGDAIFDLPIDAIETHCGSVFSASQAERNRALLTDPRLASVAKLGSSDAHYTNAIASCYSVFRLEERTDEGVRAAIMGGRVEPRQSDHYLKVQRLLGRVPKLK